MLICIYFSKYTTIPPVSCMTITDSYITQQDLALLKPEKEISTNELKIKFLCVQEKDENMS